MMIFGSASVNYETLFVELIFYNKVWFTFYVPDLRFCPDIFMRSEIHDLFGILSLNIRDEAKSRDTKTSWLATKPSSFSTPPATTKEDME